MKWLLSPIESTIPGGGSSQESDETIIEVPETEHAPSGIVRYGRLIKGLEEITNPFQLEEFLLKTDENGRMPNLEILHTVFEKGYTSTDEILQMVRDCQKTYDKLFVSGVHTYLKTGLSKIPDLRRRLLRALQLPEETFGSGHEIKSSVAQKENGTNEHMSSEEFDKKRESILNQLENSKSIADAITVFGNYDENGGFRVNEDFSTVFPKVDADNIVKFLKNCNEKRANCSASLRLLKEDCFNEIMFPLIFGKILYRIIEDELKDEFKEKDERDAFLNSNNLKDIFFRHTEFDLDGYKERITKDEFHIMVEALKHLAYAKGFTRQEFLKILQERVDKNSIDNARIYDFPEIINSFKEADKPSEEELAFLVNCVALFGYLKGIDNKGNGLQIDEVINLISSN